MVRQAPSPLPGPATGLLAREHNTITAAWPVRFANEPALDAGMFRLIDVEFQMNDTPGVKVGSIDNLIPHGSNCGGGPNGSQRCWQWVNAELPSSAYSVTIAGATNRIVLPILQSRTLLAHLQLQRGSGDVLIHPKIAPCVVAFATGCRWLSRV